MIVLPDADMDLAADAAVSAGYGSAGERCMAISVVVTVGNAADQLLPKVAERIAKLQVGPGDREGSEMGPLVTREHRDKVKGYIDAGESEGATLLADGRGLRVEGFEEGFYLGPTLFDNVSPDMSIYRDEIFGPVLSVVRVDHYEDAIELINDNPYGNGTAVFTNDGGAARKFQNEIQVGMVGINVPIPVPLSFYSFGGWKDSIFGSHAIYGPEGIRFYTRQKVVISRWPTRSTAAWTSASPSTASKANRPWTSGSSCKPIHPPVGWSSSPLWPRASGSRTRGRSTPMCCGRSRS
jgi:malonate-semialdehyde dehydrogenase (acetylating) / methylmalonate-semialdehyde dehydrogenase